MRVINLARRPFVNRRPILRVAGLLWLAGALLLVLNVYLYRSHWVNSKAEREALARVERELDLQEELLAAQHQKLENVNPGLVNPRAAFLNALILYRTFPWSVLFEDLEEVLPADVRLLNVKPDVRLSPETRRRRSGAAGSRTQGRRTAVSRTASRRSGDGQREDAPGTDGGRTSESRDAEPLRSDEVALSLSGFAKSPDALYEFVDRLYESPFRGPFLANEALDRNQGPETVGFSLSVIYLTRRPEPPARETATAEAEGGDPLDPGGVEDGTRSAGGEEDSDPGQAPGPESTRLVTGSEAPAEPDTAGRPASSPSFIARRAPATRRPAQGTVSGRTAPGAASEPDSRNRPGLARSGTVIPGIPGAVQPPPAGDPRRVPPPPAADPARAAADRSRRARTDPANRRPPDRNAPEERDAREREATDRERRTEPSEDEDSGFRDDDASATPRTRGRLRAGQEGVAP